MEANTLQAKELRIGNLINRYDKIIYVNLGVINKIQNGSVIYKPIPLSEDIILKLGFEIEGLRGYYNAEFDLTVEFINGKYAFTICDYEQAPATTHYIMHCEFLHTFQNNAFALTSKELTIKE